MRMTKMAVTMTVAIAATIGYAGDSAPIRLDTDRPSFVDNDTLTLTWDASWIGGDANATVMIVDNGVEVKRTTGAGEMVYLLASRCRHELTYTTYVGDVAQEEVYRATFFKDWEYEASDGGAIITLAAKTSGDVTIPSEIDGLPVVGIGASVFSGCAAITSVTIPQYVCTERTLSDVFPSAYQAITNVVVADGVTRIGNALFKECAGLTSVAIPDTVTSIGDEAFFNCSSLEALAIPDSVTRFGLDCFERCPAYTRQLYRVIFGGGTPGGGSPQVSTTIVQQVESRYDITNRVADRAIASVTVDSDCDIDSFVLTDGKVYDSVLYISNTAANAVTLSLPAGNTYMAFKGTAPLMIPAQTQYILTITRVADTVFLVSREDLEAIQ